MEEELGKETVVRNLEAALEKLGPRLIDLGYKGVTAKESARAKDVSFGEQRPEQLVINVEEGIVDISWIRLYLETWKNVPNLPTEINIHAWKDEDENGNQLSGPATAEQFEKRIMTQINEALQASSETDTSFNYDI